MVGLSFVGYRMFLSLMQDKMPDPALASEPPAAKETGLDSYEVFFTWRDSDRAHEYLRTYTSRPGVMDLAVRFERFGFSAVSWACRCVLGSQGGDYL